jgi:outer membrane protein assembly factor BamA
VAPPRLITGLFGLTLASCGGPPAAHTPISARCTADRVGTVHVEGADRALVPGLAVLEGTLIDPERTERITQAAEEALRYSGYARARVAVSTEQVCFTDLNVIVDLGPKYQIARIDFQTDDEFPAKERLAALEDELGRVNTIGGIHIDYRLRRALKDLQERYRDAGWLDARIGTPEATYDDGDALVSLSIPVEAGERYRIGAITAHGGNSGVRQTILEEIGIEEGAWYDGPTIRRGLERARKLTKRKVVLREVDAEAGVIELEAVVAPKKIAKEPKRRIEHEPEHAQ